MFWTNKAFEIVILLLGLGIVRVIIRRVFPWANDSRLDCIYFFIFLIWVAVSWIGYQTDENSKASLEKALQESQYKVMEAEERVLTKMGNGYKWRGAGQRYYGSPIIRVERTDGRTTQESLYT